MSPTAVTHLRVLERSGIVCAAKTRRKPTYQPEEAALLAAEQSFHRSRASSDPGALHDVFPGVLLARPLFAWRSAESRRGDSNPGPLHYEFDSGCSVRFGEYPAPRS
jgi:hypothetical protein